MSKLALTLRLFHVGTHVLRGVVVTAWILPRISREDRNQAIQRWARQLLQILRIEWRVSGVLPVPEQMPVLLTSNHVSWVDIFVIQALHPVRFVSKSEVRAWPVLGWLADRTGTLFLVRASRRQTAEIGAQMQSVLAQGDSLGLFPESTTSDGQRVLPFRSPMLQSAVDSKRPLLPIFLHYKLADGQPNPHLPFVGSMTFAESLLKILRGPASLVEIRVGPLTQPVQQHRRELAVLLEQHTRALMVGTTRAGYLEQGQVVQTYGSETSSPQAASIQCQ